MVELFLIDVLLRASGNDTTRTDIVQIVEPLRRVETKIVDINALEGIDRLSLQTYIIIIGRGDDGHFRLSIAQTLQLCLAQLASLLIDSLQGLHRILTVFVELAILGTTLTKTHLLNVSNKLFYLIISDLWNFIQPLLRLIVLHLDNIGEGQVVEGFCPTLVIIF